MTRRIPTALALGAILALSSPAARGDVIFQPGGGKIVGEIVEEKDDYVAIRTKGGGVLKVGRDEIDRIERGPVSIPAPPPPKGLPAPPAGDPLAPTPVPTPIPKAPNPPAPPKLGSPGAVAFGVDEEKLVPPRVRAVLEWFERHKAELRASLAAALKARRKEALEFIRDPKRYPEENHGAEAQPEVDRLVALVRSAWADPFAEALEASAELRRLVAELDEVAVDLALVRERVNRALSFEAQAPPEDRFAEEAKAVAAHDAKVKTSIDAEERACIEATNRYRLMYGLKALRIDERLVQAARKHARSMVERGFFDHTSPVPGLETPEKRCAAEGANYSAENIAFGSTEGEPTFRMWYTSSGHHRNLLADHLTIGVGKHVTHWTQNFGKDALKQQN